MKRGNKTKALKGKSSQPATQHDLELWGGELTQRMDGFETRMAGFETRMDRLETKMDQFKDEILRHFDVVVEHIEAELRGANRDEISILKTKQKQHEQRISVLERRSGLPSA